MLMIVGLSLAVGLVWFGLWRSCYNNNKKKNFLFFDNQPTRKTCSIQKILFFFPCPKHTHTQFNDEDCWKATVRPRNRNEFRKTLMMMMMIIKVFVVQKKKLAAVCFGCIAVFLCLNAAWIIIILAHSSTSENLQI